MVTAIHCLFYFTWSERESLEITVQAFWRPETFAVTESTVSKLKDT